MTRARAGTSGGARVPWLLVLVLLAGCGRGAEVAATVPATAAPGLATARSTAPPTARSAARPTGPAAGSADPVDRLRGTLLGPGDLGAGWTVGDPPVPDPSTPAPCGGPGTVARYPDALRVGSTVDGPAGFVVQEALSVYGDADTARAAFGAGLAGLDCGRGTLHGAPVAIAPAQAADVGGDRASSWRVGSDSVDEVLVMVQAREAVFSFAYVTPLAPAGGGGAAPDPLALSRAAVARALAA